MEPQAGLVTSEEPLCVRRRERAQSLSVFFFLPSQKEVFYQLWWKILDGLSKSCSCLQGQWHVLLPCMSEHKRCRAKHSAGLAAVLTGDNNRTAEDQKQNNWNMVTLSFAILAQGEARIVRFQFQNKKVQLVQLLDNSSYKTQENHSSGMAFLQIRSSFDIHNVWK